MKKIYLTENQFRRIIKESMMHGFPDISTVGQINYEWDLDTDDYLQYLQDNNLEDNRPNFTEYVNDNVEFELEFFDNDTFHSMGFVTATLDDIESEYGENYSNKIFSDCLKDGQGQIETSMMYDDVDINDPNSVNNVAKKLFSSGRYVKDGRGYILTDGTCIYTWSEHSMCTQINGVNGTFHFIKLGNIRFLPKSIDIGKEPTPQQYDTLETIISNYRNDMLYLDIMDDGEISATYTYPEPFYVIREIKNYFNNGTKPKGN